MPIPERASRMCAVGKQLARRSDLGRALFVRRMMRSALTVSIFSGVALAVSPGAAAAQEPTPTPGLKMYEGSIGLHFFGNDSMSKATPPFDAYVFTALPLGEPCNPYVSGGMTCDPTATLQVGAPLTGNGEAAVGGSSPASIMLPAFQLGRIASGTLPPMYSNEVYRKTYANLWNGMGTFGPGNGPGSVHYYNTSVVFKADIFPGKNQFGGVMRLLKGVKSGGLRERSKFSVTPSLAFVGNVPTKGIAVIGAASSGGAPYVGKVNATSYRTAAPSVVYSISGSALGWPWTTGKVRVRAYGDYVVFGNYSLFAFPESLTRTGYDNRTSMGDGVIQLVTPHVVNWGLQSLQLGAIGVMRLEFVPEPSSGLAVLAGASFLCALYRRCQRG